MKKLAIIGAQRMAKHYAINAREMGVETYCFAWDQGAVAKEFADHFHPISIFDTDKILAELNNIGVDGIVSTSELTIAIVAELAEKCQQYQWCWSKNSVGEMSELQHNNCDGVNHFIWKSSDGFPKELELIRAGAQI